MKNIEFIRNIDLGCVRKHAMVANPTMDHIKKAFEKTGLYIFNDEQSSANVGIFSLNMSEVQKHFKNVPEADNDECTIRVLIHGGLAHPYGFVVDTPEGYWSATCVLIGDNLYYVGQYSYRLLIPQQLPILWVYDE